MCLEELQNNKTYLNLKGKNGYLIRFILKFDDKNVGVIEVSIRRIITGGRNDSQPTSRREYNALSQQYEDDGKSRRLERGCTNHC